MNTTHKWNSFNDYSYHYYPQKTEPYKKEDMPEETVARTEDLNTNFLNLPKDFKIKG